MSESGAAADAKSARLKHEQTRFGKWLLSSAKGCIMTHAQEVDFEEQLNLPHLPDMVFSGNYLKLEYDNRFEISFTALDALKTVNDHQDLIHVSMSDQWLAARESHSNLNKIIKPFDWTFTPNDYRGTLQWRPGQQMDGFQPTTDCINYEKLKQKEQILFYDDVILYEDELDDHGCSSLSAKIRLMPSGFFCLLRFYLRIDHTLVRLHDTRLYYESENSFILREYSQRESKTSDLDKVASQLVKDPNEIANYLKLTKEVAEKLSFH